jgi:hypothetical protein
MPLQAYSSVFVLKNVPIIDLSSIKLTMCGVYLNVGLGRASIASQSRSGLFKYG